MADRNSEAGSLGRFGYVSAYDPARHMARIQFPDKGNLVSDWLPVAVRNSGKNKDECHLDVGEHVYCSMMGNGLESGVVLCSIFDDTNKPPAGNQDIRKTTFGDGTEIIYDRNSKKLTINCSGDIEIKASGEIKINAGGGVDFSGGGDMNISGSTINLN